MANKKYVIKIEAKEPRELKTSVDRITFTLNKIPETIARIARQLKPQKISVKGGNAGPINAMHNSALKSIERLRELFKKLGDNKFYKDVEITPLKGYGDANFIKEMGDDLKVASVSASKAATKLRTFKQVLDSLGSKKIASLSNADLQEVFKTTLGKETKTLKRVLDSAGVKTKDYNSLIKKSETATIKRTKALEKEVKVEKLSEKQIKRKARAEQKAADAEEAKSIMTNRRAQAQEEVFETSSVKGSGKNAATTNLRAATAGGRGAQGRDMSSLASIANSDSRGIVAAYATLAANVFAITTAFRQLSEAAKFDQLLKGLRQLGAASGQTFSVMVSGLREITGFAVNTRDAMRSVALATSAGLAQSDIEGLAKVAKGASIALGRNLGDAMDRLTRGAIKLEPEILDELGIMVRLDDAVQEYANRLGKAKSGLTSFERRQAFLTAVLEQGERKFGDIADAVDVSPYDRLTASLQDTSVGVSRLLNSFLAPLAGLFASNPALLAAPFALLANTVAGKVLPNFESMQAKLEKLNISLENQSIPFIEGEEVQNKATLKNRTQALKIAQKHQTLIVRLGKKNKTTFRQLQGILDVSKRRLDVDVQNLETLKRTLVKESARIRSLSRITKSKAEELAATEELINLTDRMIKQESRRLALQTEISERKNKQVLNEGNSAALAVFEKRIATANIGAGFGLVSRTKEYINFLFQAGRNSSIFYDNQKTNILIQNDLLGKNDGLLNKISTSGRLMGSRISAGLSFASVAAKGFSVVLSRMIPIIGVLATLGAVATSAFRLMFEDSSVKKFQKAQKNVSEIVSQLQDKWETLDQLQRKASVSASQYAQKFTIISALSDELTSSFNKLALAQSRMTKAWQRPFRFLDDATLIFLASKGTGGSIGGGNISDAFFGAKSKQVKELNKQLRSAPDEYLAAIEKAKTALGGFSDSISKSDQIDLVANILKRANAEFKDLNKIVPELEQNFVNMERSIRSFNTSAKASTSVDGLVDSMVSLNNVTQSLENSKIEKRFEILTRFSSEASDSLLNFLNLTDSEMSTLRQLKEINQEIKDSSNLFEKFANQLKLVQLDKSLIRLPDAVKEAEGYFKRVQARISTLKADISSLEALATVEKAYDFETSKAEVLRIQLQIKNKTLKVAQDELVILRRSNSNQAAIDNKRLEISKLGADINASITVGLGEQLKAASQLAKIQKRLVATTKTRKELEDKIYLSARQQQILASGGKSRSPFENEFDTNFTRIQNSQLSINLEVASSQEKQASRLVAIHKLEQDIAEARLKTNGFSSELIASKTRELNLIRSEIGLENTKIRLLEQQASTAKTALIPSREKFKLLKQEATLLKTVATLENSRVDSLRELSLAQLRLENARASGSAVLSPEQEIQAKKQELRDRVTALQNINTQEQSLIMLRGVQLDQEALIRKQELAAIRQKFLLLKAQNPDTAFASEFSDVLSIIETLDNNIYEKQNDRMKLEQQISSIKADGARIALQTEITMGNAGDRFLASQRKSLNSQREILQNGRGFLAQLPFIGSTYAAVFDNFKNTTGRVPNETELAKIKTSAVYQTRVSAQLEAQSTLASSLEGSFDTLYDSILNGNDSVAESFKKMAISIIADLAKVYTKALLVQAITALLPGGGYGANAAGAVSAAKVNPGHFGAVPKFASGGVMSNQGIVNKGTYLAGEGKLNEAIVPLPNGKAIPVDMSNISPGQSNNVIVNVSVDADGQASAKTKGDDMGKFGDLLSQAVIKVLLEEKRSGGILNKNGAA